MVWVSGPTTKCCQCDSPALRLVRETWERDLQIFTAEVRCTACGTAMLDSRRPTQPRPPYSTNGHDVAPGSTNDAPVDPEVHPK
jgi:hypothetical protein